MVTFPMQVTSKTLARSQHDFRSLIPTSSMHLFSLKGLACCNLFSYLCLG